MLVIMTYFSPLENLANAKAPGNKWGLRTGKEEMQVLLQICLYRYSKDFIHKMHLSDKPGTLTVC